jgi:hemoglobin-like flavoprotein
VPAGDGSAHHDEDLSGPNHRTGDVVRNPAQVSFFLLEPTADAAMTYFYGQLFAMDTEIRAMFPAAMDVQRRRFFRALLRIADSQDDLPALVPYLERLGRAHRKYGVREQHYEVFRRALMATLRFATRWDETARQGWESTFDQATAIMLVDRGAPRHLIRHDLSDEA